MRPLTPDEQLIIRTLADFYLGSDQFNGTPVRALLKLPGLDAAPLVAIHTLVAGGMVEVVRDVNPQIKRFRPPAVDQQLRFLQDSPDSICLYPSPAYLEATVPMGHERERPFTRRLCLGAPQIEPVFFELHVLERYHGDPRYRFNFHDYAGSISISDAHYDAETTYDRDKVLLQTFGMARNERGGRVVAVFTYYLSRLTPAHQQHWLGHIYTGECRIVADYFRTAILGEWAENISIYDALLAEQSHINAMCALIGYPPLFRHTFEAERPRALNVLLRPTRHGYDEFVQTLDKLLSENLNRDFFASQGMVLEDELVRDDGRIEVRPKGTVRLLGEWLQGSVRLDKESSILDLIVEVLREVRNLRQRPAHAVQADEFDPHYHQSQDELIERVYTAVRSLRLVLALHPATRDYDVPSLLYEGKVEHY